MESAREKIAENFENREPEKVKVDSSLSSAKNTMEEKELRALPVVNSKNQLQGIIGYRDLVRHLQFNPSSTKLEKVIHQPPNYSEGDSLVKLCDLRINSGRKMLVRTDQHEHIEAVVGDMEFARALSDVEELSRMETGRVETRDLIEVFEEDTVEKARHLMLDNNISRLPVLDKNGNLEGVLRSTDVLRALVARESMDAGGTRGDRQGDEVLTAGGGEKESMSDITVRELMSREISTSEDHMPVTEACAEMRDSGLMEVLFVDGTYPESIVTLKDAVKEISDLAPEDTILVSLTGLDLPEEKAVVHNAVKRQIQGSIGRKIDRPEELRIHVKKSEKDGKRHRYELNFRLFSEFGQTNVDSEAWELMDAVDEGLEDLDTKLRKEKSKHQDH